MIEYPNHQYMPEEAAEDDDDDDYPQYDYPDDDDDDGDEFSDFFGIDIGSLWSDGDHFFP